MEVLCETRPVDLLGDKALETVRRAPVVLGRPDAVGRSWPLPRSSGDELALVEMGAGLFVAAMDRDVDLEGLDGGDLQAGPLGSLWVDSESWATGMAGVFACGDVATRARNAIEAVATGVRAARQVVSWLDKERSHG